MARNARGTTITKIDGNAPGELAWSLADQTNGASRCSTARIDGFGHHLRSLRQYRVVEPERAIRDAVDERVRLANIADLEQVTALSIGIQSLHAQGRPDLFRVPDEHALRAFIANRIESDDLVLVADKGDRLVGYLVAEVVSRPENPFDTPRRLCTSITSPSHPRNTVMA